MGKPASLLAAVGALLLAAGCVLASWAAPLPRRGALALSEADLAADARLRIDSGWRYHPGDDPAWAAADLDDSGWALAGSLLAGEPPAAGWPGIGWFRMRLRLSAELRRIPLSLLVAQRGASELYVDGRLAHRFGTIAAGAESESALWPRRPVPLPAAAGPEMTLAIRYANRAGRRSPSGDVGLGFHVELLRTEAALAAVERRWLRELGPDAARMAVGAALAILHLLLYAFNPRERENLLFALIALGFAGLTWADGRSRSAEEPAVVLFHFRLASTCGMAMGLAMLRFVYSIFSGRVAPVFRVIFVIGLGMIAWVWLAPDNAVPNTPVMYFALLCAVDLLRVAVAGALDRRRSRAWLLYVGFIVFAGGGLLQIGQALEVLDLGIYSFHYGILFLFLTMSIYLSQRFADTSRALELELAEVERLSAEALRREREARQQEIERSLLAAENERRRLEMEEARELQLSMLPRERPSLPGLDVAFEMRTATEVGGDYYDFEEEEDGPLTLAIGDATGHGLQAGLLVAATRSFFKAAGPRADLAGLLGDISNNLRRMHLGRMNMALTLARIRDGSLELAAAGMPPPLVFRARTSEVEECLIQAPPLGTFASHAYRSERVPLHPGDALLFVSDGLPEMLDPDDEVLGYAAIQAAFAAAARQGAEEIVGRLFDLADRWARSRQLADDVTVLAVRIQ